MPKRAQACPPEDADPAVVSRADGSWTQLAALLSRLRSQAGLTLDRLAEASGVSRAFISQIESGAANPTLLTLDRLSAALGVRTAELLSDASARSSFQPVVRPARQVREWPTGSGRTYPLSAPEAYRFTVYLTDGASGDHDVWSEHPGEEFCMVIAGSYRLHLGSRELVIDEGSSVHYPSWLPHRISPEVTGGRVLVVFGPAQPPS